MQFCRFCGASLPDEARFCTSCGKPTSGTSDSAEVVATSTGASTPVQPSSSPLLSAKDLVLNKKILSLREHYDVRDRNGTFLGQAEGNFFQFPARFVVQDQGGDEVMHVDGKLISLRREFKMYDSSGNLLAAIKKKIVKLFGSEYWLEVNGNQLMRIYGNFVEHDYRFQVDGVDVAQVHRRWVSVRDAFNISITGSIDARLVLGSVIVIEHEEVVERRENSN